MRVRDHAALALVLLVAFLAVLTVLAALRRGSEPAEATVQPAASQEPVSRVQPARIAWPQKEADLLQSILFWKDGSTARVDLSGLAVARPGVVTCQAGKYRYCERYDATGLVLEAWGETCLDGQVWTRHGLTTIWNERGGPVRVKWFQEGKLIREDLPGNITRKHLLHGMVADEYPDGKQRLYEEGKLVREDLPDGTSVHHDDGEPIADTPPP